PLLSAAATSAEPASSPNAAAGLAPLESNPITPAVAATPIAPPARQPEIINPEPSAAHVWIPGAWERSADQWQWVPGHWTEPPFGNARWVAGYWKYEAGQYVWVAGHWAATEPGRGMVVENPVEPPPLPVASAPAGSEPPSTAPPGAAPVAAEPPVASEPPSANHRWVPGHWDWVNGWWW